MLSRIAEDVRLARIEPPQEDPIAIVLDTDTKNEIDDQFALAYALTSPRIHCAAVYAAPFKTQQFPSAAEGMAASYDEAVRVTELLRPKHRPPILKGSDYFIAERGQASPSPAVEDLINRCASERLVRVVAIGALTNIASALSLEPSIADKLVVVWLGGHPDYWPHNREFNVRGDLKAAQIVLDSGVPLVRVPCKAVAELLMSTPSEIEQYVAPCGEIGAYLSRIFAEHIPGRLRSKAIWDLAPLAWLVNPAWVATKVAPTPRLLDDFTWDHSDTSRPVNRVAVDVRRDPILADFVACLERHVAGEAGAESPTAAARDAKGA